MTLEADVSTAHLHRCVCAAVIHRIGCKGKGKDHWHTSSH